MKVIEINATYGYTSTGNIVKDIETTLNNNGHECAVAYQSALVKPKNGFKVGNFFDRKWHALWTRIYGAQGYASRCATKKLIKWIRKQKPDIVNLHNVHSNYINLNMLLSFFAKENIRTVISLHDCWFFTGKCFHFIEDGCYKWKESCGTCPRKKKDAISFVDRSKKVLKDKKEKFNAIKNLTVVASSKWVGGLVEESILKDKPKAHIYNGIDTKFFSPNKRVDHPDKFVILGDGNKWTQQNNLELLDLVYNSLLDDDLLVLYGIRDEHLEVLKNYPKIYKIPYENNKEKMAKIFASSDVFVNATHADTLPTVNMEAASTGTPVITYNACGSPELVSDCVSGYVVEVGDVLGMMEAIKKVKDGKISRKDVRDFAEKSFDKEKNYLKYLELFETLLG